MSYCVQYKTRKRHGYAWRTIGPFRYATRELAVNAARLMFPQGYPVECVRFRHVTKG